jgi:hypothetical protein
MKYSMNFAFKFLKMCVFVWGYMALTKANLGAYFPILTIGLVSLSSTCHSLKSTTLPRTRRPFVLGSLIVGLSQFVLACWVRIRWIHHLWVNSIWYNSNATHLIKQIKFFNLDITHLNMSVTRSSPHNPFNKHVILNWSKYDPFRPAYELINLKRNFYEF